VAEWADHPRRNLALGLVAYAAWARGDHDGALELGRESLSSERRHDAEPSWAAWQSIGDAAWFRGWSDEAMRHYAEWVDRARQVGDDFNLSSALAHLAVAESFLNRPVAKHELADEALDLARRCGSPYLVALTLYAKSECVIDKDPEAAMKLVEEGATIGRESGNRFAYGLCLTTLASLTGRFGDPVEALGLYRVAVENWSSSGNWTNQRVLLRNLAVFATRIGEHALTARLLAALEASGEMLGAEIGPEGERVAGAVDIARRALGGDRYDEIALQGAKTHPLVLVRDTLELLELLSARTGSTAAEAGPRATPGGLSPREQEVVSFIARGLTNREIAALLFISERTVETHISRIRRKLGTTTRTQLAIWGSVHAG
jgi:DNA-binding CsgD family transcriptional regulator